MSLRLQRIIHDDNGTLVDLSKQANEMFGANASLPIVAADDKLYIGSSLPFNHRHFEVATANAATSVVSTVEIWDGNSWVAAVDLVDYTLNSGSTVTLYQNGIISWTVDRDSSWGLEESTENIPALATLKIYDMYWARMTFSANLSNTTAIKYIGYKFSDDDKLRVLYPDLVRSTLLTAWQTAKTTWDEQHIIAAEEIIERLQKLRIIWNRNQILDWQRFEKASVHKCAEIIYRGLGADYDDKREKAKDDFEKALNVGQFNIDVNADGHLERAEQFRPAGLFRS